MGIFYALVFFFAFVFIILPLIFLGAPFLPSYKKSETRYLDEVFNLLQEHKTRDDCKFVDLGSGDDRVVIGFAQRGYGSYGIEINPILVLISMIKIKMAGVKNAKIIRGNFWKFDLSHFDIIYFFQYKLANKFLERKLKNHSKNEVIIISACFPLKNFNLIKRVGNFYIYKNILIMKKNF